MVQAAPLRRTLKRKGRSLLKAAKRGRADPHPDLLSALPDMLFARVVAQLDGGALRNCTRVCRRWDRRLNLNVVWQDICESRGFTRFQPLNQGLDFLNPNQHWVDLEAAGFVGQSAKLTQSALQCAWKRYFVRCAGAPRRLLTAPLPPAHIFGVPESRLIAAHCLHHVTSENRRFEHTLTSLQTGQIILSLQLDSPQASVAVSPCRRFAALATPTATYLAKFSTRVAVEVATHRRQPHLCLTKSRLLVASAGPLIRAFKSTEPSAPPLEIKCPANLKYCAVHEDLVACWNQSFWVYVVNATNGHVTQLKNSTFVKQVQFFQNGQFLLCLEDNGTDAHLTVWHLPTQQLTQKVEINPGSSFAARGDLVLIACPTSDTALWLLKFNGSERALRDVWNSHGLQVHLAAGGGGGVPLVWFVDGRHFVVNEGVARVCRVEPTQWAVRTRRIRLPDAHFHALGATPSQLVFRQKADITPASAAFVLLDFDYSKF